jgi:aspartate aminotransferase
MAPPDKIFGLTVAFQNDESPDKINLGVGAYRDDDGKPFILKSVQEAEKRILSRHSNHEYSAIQGNDVFIKCSEEFTFGENSAVMKEKRIASIQCLSGTGSLRVIAECYKAALNSTTPPKVYLPNPTWANHINIFKKGGLEPVSYGYYDDSLSRFNVKLLLDSMDLADDNSLFCLHACSHNPTGSDPSKAEWDAISQKVKEKNHLILFDNAYQGYASGDAERDAYAVRKFVEDGHNVIVSQSYSKNFGLYGERIGCLSVVAQNSDEASRVMSLLKSSARAMYSNPPIYGARIVSEILLSPELKLLWKEECAAMTARIIQMRKSLRSELMRLGSTHNWDHITLQTGMFCYSGLTKDQIGELKNKHHIYCTDDGRISIAGVTSKNVSYLAESIHDVTK